LNPGSQISPPQEDPEGGLVGADVGGLVGADVGLEEQGAERSFALKSWSLQQM
jgi:hypothetical protein